MYLSQAEQLLEAIFIAHRDNRVSYRFATMFHGAAGIGKTQFQKEIATKCGMALINVRVGQLEPGDLLGIPHEVERNGVMVTEYSIPGYLPRYKYDKNGKPVLRRDGTHALAIDEMGDDVANREELLEMFNGDLNEVRGVVLLLDEITRAAGDEMKQAIFQMPEQYRLHTYLVPRGCVITANVNPNNGDYQVNDMDADKAFMDRFLHIKLRSRLEDWMIWAKRRGIDERIIQFYNLFPDALHAEEPYFSLNVDRSQRSAELMHTLLTEVDLPQDDSVLKEVYMGVYGEKYGTIFDKHLRENIQRTPSAEEIILDFPKWHGAVERAVKENDTGYWERINRSIFTYCSDQKNWGELEEHLHNLVSYLKLLHKDTRMIFTRQLARIRVGKAPIAEILGESDELHDFLYGDANEADAAW